MATTDKVKISVLMPVFNGSKYLELAIRSILTQSLPDFELLVIDDGSTDTTPEILASIKDKRIRAHRIENSGVAKALNLGVDLAKGDYIARMDADDRAHPDRLLNQSDVLDQDADIGLVCSLARQIDSYGAVTRGEIGENFTDLEMKWALIWKNEIIHPSVMIRRSVLIQNKLNYSIHHNKAEDFALWSQLAQVTNMAVINTPLIDYRVHAQSVTGKNTIDKDNVTEHLIVFKEVIRENLDRYGVAPNEVLVNEIAVIGGGTGADPRTYQYIKLVEGFDGVIGSVMASFCSQHVCTPKELQRIRAKQLLVWSRNMIATSKKSAFKMLLSAIMLNVKVVVTRQFYKIVALILIPGLNITTLR